MSTEFPIVIVAIYASDGKAPPLEAFKILGPKGMTEPELAKEIREYLSKRTVAVHE